MTYIKQSSSRNTVADFVKGILILCVLYSHSIQQIDSLRNASWTTSFINVFVTCFEMPLFILVSGYFLNFSLRNKTYKEVLIKRVFCIAPPILIWEGIPALVSFVISLKEKGFSIVGILKIAYKCVLPGKLWFLGAYLYCSIFVIIIEWLCSLIESRKRRITVKIIIYTAVIVVLQFFKYPAVHLPYLFPFFLLGFILSKYNLLENLSFRKTVYLISVLFVFLYLFYKAEYSMYLFTYIEFKHILTQLPILLYRFILGVCGCGAVYSISRFVCTKFPNSKVVPCLCLFGEKTMELYILSVFVQDAMCFVIKTFWRDTAIINDITSPLLFAPIFLVIMMVICFTIDYIIGKIRVLHKALFGR